MTNLRDTNLNLLVAFDALLSERSVTRAAERVGLTQPAMSRALGQLRRVFDDPLFVRVSGGVEPTRRAVELREPVRSGLEALSRALDPARDFQPETSHGSFVAAMSDYAELVLLPGLLRRLAERAPGFDLHVVPWGFDEPVAPLQAGEVDLMVGFNQPRTLPPGHLELELFEDPFVCIARNGHPRVRSRLTLKAYLELSHIIVRGRRGALGAGDVALAAVGRKRRIGARVPSFFVVPELVAATDMIAAMDSRLAYHFARFLPIRVFKPPIPFPPERTVMVWHARDTTHPAQIWFREQIRELCEEMRRSVPGGRKPRK